MKKTAMIILSAFIAFVLLSADLPAKQRAIRVKARAVDGSTKEFRLYSGYYALMIGCGDYTDSMIPDLPNAVKDIKELAKMLKGMGFEVKTVLNPKSYKIEEAFNRLIAGVGRERGKAILVYFAGHGETLTQADGIKLGYILPVDTPHPERDYLGFLSKAISMKRIDEVSRLIQSKHVLMVFDSCFSGALFGAVRDLPKYITEKTAKPVREYITAGTEDEKVPDNSIFKRVFLQGLEDRYADLNDDGYITGLELGMHLSDKVVQYSNGGQHPQAGKINHPALDKGDFILVLKTPSPRIQISVVPPPPPESDRTGDYDKLIQERKATKKKWDHWQGRMEEDFAKVERYDQTPELTPKEKKEIWSNFLSSYRADNPYAAKDDDLKQKAEARFRHWSSLIFVPTIPKPEKRELTESEFYDRTLGLYKDGRYEEAIADFKSFLKSYPESDLADNAQFWIGECFRALKEYEEAILAYQKVINGYPNGNKTPSAMLHQGFAFEKINDKETANLVFKKLVKNFPKTREAESAKRRLRQN